MSLIFSFFGVVFSPALQSIGLICMLIAVGWEWFRRKGSLASMTNPSTKMQLLIPFLLFLLVLTDFLRGIPLQITFDMVISRLAFVLIPLAVAIFHHQLREYLMDYMLLAFGSLLSIVGMISSFRYLGNRAYYDELLVQSKHIPIAGGMNHIYFSLAAALVLSFIIFSLRHFYQDRMKTRWIIAMINGVILLVCMHLLSTRTGLLVLYSGIGSAVLISATKGWIRPRAVILILGLMILLPVTAFYTFSSFRSKVENSWEDIQAIRGGGEEINHKSMGMRIESYRVGSLLLVEHWAIGVGKSNVKPQMQIAYEQAGTLLNPENRIEPHNQFLHFGIAFGVAGLALFSFFWLLPFFDVRNLHPIYMSILVIFLLTAMLEPILERQSGMFLFFFFYFWFMERQGNTFAIEGRFAQQL